MRQKHPPSYWREFIPKTWSAIRKQYSFASFKSDFIAGITVGIVSLPLAMAFAIAAGLSPTYGLSTAIVAGFLTSLLSGSRYQIGGPTGAFVIIIYGILVRRGYEGLVAVTLIAGLILLISAFSRIGSWIKYIPYPLVTGFTTGIAVVIFSSQMKDFFGLNIKAMPADFISMWKTLAQAFPTTDLPTLGVALFTLLSIIIIRRFVPILPWGITAVVISTIGVWGFEIPTVTIKQRFGEVVLNFSPPDFMKVKSLLFHWRELIADAFTVAFLAGIESLLCALVADGMTGRRHRSNCELMAQGVANIGSALFGGIPATGAIARTATNIKSGAKSPIAGMICPIVLFLIVFFMSPLVGKIPMAALSAILVMIAWNMSELHHFRHLFKAPIGDIAVLLLTFLLTVFVDLTVAVGFGMILAVFLFMKRISDTTKVTSLDIWEKRYREGKEEALTPEKKVPHGVEIYEIDGPFFFGVADSLKDVLLNIEFSPQIFILHMRNVPYIDASAMHALREFYYLCKRDKTALFLSGVGPSLHEALKKFKVISLIGEKHIFEEINQALKAAEHQLKSHTPS
jgi:sulfate permease, SulP family